MRMLLHSPKDMFAGALAAAAVVAIIVNALFLQAGRHPSPMFGSVVTLPPPAAVPVIASPLPRPRPVEAAVRSLELAPPEVKPAEPARIVESRASDAKSPDPKSSDPRSHDPMTNLVVKSTSARGGGAVECRASAGADPHARRNHPDRGLEAASRRSSAR